MKSLLSLFVFIIPIFLFSQTLRDSKNIFYKISSDQISESEDNIHLYKLDFNHKTPFLCVSFAWNENSLEPTSSHFNLSFSEDSLNWTAWESLYVDEHATD